MKYGSVCSGIEAATVAWHPLGWEPAFFSDVEPYPRALLRHHYPDVPLHGRDIKPKEDFGGYCDEAGFQTIGKNQYGTIDLLVGGTPCQSFSVAGKRGGLGDGRGNLALEYIRLADRKRPRWVVWENVPGVFSSTQGEDFRCFLSGLVRWSVPIPDGGWSNGGIIAPGPVDGSYGVAWRVLNAQYFGVPQRRRRVFVVGYLGDWRPAAAVLFERHSLSGHPAPRREKEKGAAESVIKGAAIGRKPENGPQFGEHLTDGSCYTLNCSEVHAVAHTLNASHGVTEDGTGREDGHTIIPEPRTFAGNIESQVAATLQTTCDDYSRSDGFNCVAIRTANTGANGHGVSDKCAHTLDQAQGQAVALPINTQIATRGEALGEGTGFGIGEDGDPAFTLQAAHSHGVAVTQYGNDAGNFACNRDGAPIAFDTQAVTENVRGEVRETSVTNALAAGGGKPGQGYAAVRNGMAVRRLTPIECERLQGFPDGYTAIPWRGKEAGEAPDGPRYKALGNSFAVPVVRWLGERIQLVQDILDGK